MSSNREQILNALVSILATDALFPAAELDEPEPTDFIAIAGQNAAHVLAVQEGTSVVTRDGGRDDDWELELEITVAYAVQCSTRQTRRALRDAACVRLQTLIASNRTLGLSFLPYVEIRDLARDDNIPTEGGVVIATAILTLAVTYVALSAAG